MLAAVLQLGNGALSLALHRLIVIPMRPFGEHARPSPHADCRLKGVDQNGNRFPLPFAELGAEAVSQTMGPMITLPSMLCFGRKDDIAKLHWHCA